MRDRADRARRTDPARDFRVAGGPAGRNRAQRLPDAVLERGSADVERKVEGLSWGFHQANDASDHALEFGIAADQFGAPETVLQIAREGVRIIAERIAQTPCSLAATKMAPSEHWPIANRIRVRSPPAR